jgi:MFS transporter, MHS family, shikimate and dehydroshikimate transport protein
MAQQAIQEVDTRTLVIVAFSATAGVLVEFYDFTIFGFAVASAFPAIFFPNLGPTQGLVFSYLTYGAGYPARLFGAFLFGHFGDRAGRKFAFLLNIVVVGGSTVLTGLLPGYATLGTAAPILLVLLRIVQGIGVGGEFGGATSLLSEFGAKRRHRAFWMSLANLGIALGLMASSAVFLLLSKTFATTGWRIAMLLSAIIVVPALVARYKLADSPLFEQLKQREQVARMPSLAVFRKHATPIILLATISAFILMDSVVSGPYIVSFMRFAGIPVATTAAIIFLSRIGDVLGVLLSGPLADLCKRRMVAYFSIGLSTLLSYPYILAIISKRILLVTALQFFMVLFGLGLLHGLAPILISESFPTKFRYSGTGISFSLAGILGGMLAPPLLSRFVGQDVLHKWYYVPVVYAIYCAAAMAALLFVRETRDLRMEDLDAKTPGLPEAENATLRSATDKQAHRGLLRPCRWPSPLHKCIATSRLQYENETE